MKNIRKIVLVCIAFIGSISTVIGVYAWFTLQPATEALDLNVRSTELLSSSARINIGGENINFNHSYYNKDELAIIMTKSQIQSNLSGSTLPITVNILVTPYKSIKVRFKITEIWTVNNIVQNRPSVFTWQYQNPTNVDNSGYYYPDQVLAKGTSSTDLSFITSAQVNTSVLNDLSNNATVKLSILVSAVQSNRANNWNMQDSNHIVKTFNLPSNVSSQQLNVIFDGVSNSQYQRGIYVEFTNGSNRYAYLWHNRTALSNRLTLPAGTYNVRINLVNHLDFIVTRSGNTIVITITYGDINSWGFEDILYAPAMIPIWSYGVTYNQGDIVYFDDAADGGENAGYYIARARQSNNLPDQYAWAWTYIQTEYSNTRVYEEGEIIYYNGKFFRAKQTVWAGNPPPLSWAWEQLGREYLVGNEYDAGDVFYIDDGEQRLWFIAYGTFTVHNTNFQTHYKAKFMSIDYSVLNNGKYKIGEYVRHNGEFYRVKTNEPYATPSIGNYAYDYIGLQYVSKTYDPNSIVFHNSQYYLALTSTSSTPPTSGSDSNWQLINHRGTYGLNTTYNRYDSVIYNGARYFWNGTGTTTGTNPETTNGWWTLETSWHHKNTYVRDAVVYHNGEHYVLRSGTSTNQEPGVTGAWQPLSMNWSPTAMYYNNGSMVSAVYYNDRYFVWQGAHNTTFTPEPGAGRNGWHEMSETWVSNNVYKLGDYVIYDGSFWELVTNTYPTDQRSVPGIDFTVWKEHPISWDPNRQ